MQDGPSRCMQLACLVSGFLSYACGSGSEHAEPPPAPQAFVQGWRPECPNHDTLATFVDSQGNVTTIAQIAASGAISLIPEFHDCQRLLVTADSGMKFGPLIGLFASLWLDTMNLKAEGQRVIPGMSQQAAMAAVTILNFDTTAYTPLHLQPGISCLYVYKNGGTWRAKIVMVSITNAQDHEACTKPLAQQTGVELAVRTVAAPGGPVVPAVARWDWDSTRKEHYIGVKCANDDLWCEVYGESAEGLAASSSDAYSGGELFSVKGWYDEQYLAIPGAAGVLRPGPVKGTIFPEPGLDRRDVGYYAEWRPVALVALSDDSDRYADKYNFRAGQAPNGNSRIFLCQGAGCTIPEGTSLDCASDSDGIKWFAKVESSGYPTTYRCIIRRKHDNLNIPGTVRWRWLKDDEGTWIRCPGSCCQMS